MTKPWEETWTVTDRGSLDERTQAAKPPKGRARRRAFISTTESPMILTGLNDDRLFAARARLAAAAPELARALLAVEWMGRERYESGPACPSCRAPEGLNHEEDCALDAALRKAGVRG